MIYECSTIVPRGTNANVGFVSVFAFGASVIRSPVVLRSGSGVGASSFTCRPPVGGGGGLFASPRLFLGLLPFPASTAARYS